MPIATHLAKDVVFSLAIISPALAKIFPLYQGLPADDVRQALWTTAMNPWILSGFLLPFAILGGVYLALNISWNDSEDSA